MEKKEIIYGRNPVLEYLKELKYGTDSCLIITQKAHGKIIDTIISVAQTKKINILVKPKQHLDDIAGTNKHQGVILESSQAIHSGSESDILKKTANNNGIIVVLDHITDPHNTGSVIRSAEAFGVDAVVIPKAHSASITPTVIKASAGATAHITIITTPNIVQFLKKAKEHGFWIVGTSDHGPNSLDKIKSLHPVILTIGSEGEGIRQLTEKTCDFVVKIPLAGKTGSLNASVAAGILIYELTVKNAI